jgi:hypothetical protein
LKSFIEDSIVEKVTFPITNGNYLELITLKDILQLPQMKKNNKRKIFSRLKNLNYLYLKIKNQKSPKKMKRKNQRTKTKNLSCPLNIGIRLKQQVFYEIFFFTPSVELLRRYSSATDWPQIAAQDGVTVYRKDLPNGMSVGKLFSLLMF